MEEDGFKLVKSKKSSKKNKKSTNIVLAEKIKEALSSEEISDFVRYLCSLNLPAIFNFAYYVVRIAGPSQAGGPWGARAPPLFGRSVNPISTRGGTLSPPSTMCPPRFSDLATALNDKVYIL